MHDPAAADDADVAAGDDAAADDGDTAAGAADALPGWSLWEVAELAGTSTRAARLALEAGVLQIAKYTNPPRITYESADRFAAACRANQGDRVAAVASDLTAQGFRRPYEIAADAGVDEIIVLNAIARGTLEAIPRGWYLLVSPPDAAHYIATVQPKRAA